MNKQLLALAAALGLSALPTLSQAQDSPLSFNIGAVTDYRYRGISQTSKKPAIQGGVDFAHKSGLYLGAWGSNVKWVEDFNGATKGNLEIDLYGGFKGTIVGDLGFDVGAIAYQYPGNNSGAAGTPGAGGVSKADTLEYYGALSYKMLTLKYSRAAGDFLGNLNSSGSSYIDLAANFDLGNGFSLSPHIGRQRVANLTVANYTDYSLTLAKDFGNGLVLSVAAIGTNAVRGGFYTNTLASNAGKFIANDTFVVGLKYGF